MKKFFIYFGIFITTCVALGGLGVALLIHWATQDLPSFTKVADYRPPQVTTIYARDGSIMTQLYRERRFLISLDEMASYVPMAFLAAEDDGFYKHDGIDPVAIVRAFIINMQAGTIRQGGSTITQQVVKRLLLSSERSYERKIKEAILSYRLERYLTKDEILSIYLNQIYLGAGAYGVEAAARTFFAKHASELTIAEAAVLGGMPQAPSKYSPFRNPNAAKQRQLYVLRRMHELAWISTAEYEAAKVEPLNYKSMDEDFVQTGMWYTEEIRRQLIELFSEENVRRMNLPLTMYGEDAVYEAGLNVQTNMEPLMQASAEAALRKGLVDATRRHGWYGPIENIEKEAYQTFITENPFAPEDLAGGQWAKALVTNVTVKGADVLLGEYKGFIDVATVHWCRVPDIKKATEEVASVKDTRKVLKEGDIVWVSGRGADGKVESFNPALLQKDKVIGLALEQYPDVQGALVSIEPKTGDVVAMVGGYSFLDSQFNRAVQAYRQPGSSFKPVVYSTALDNGFTTASMVLDAPIVVMDSRGNTIWRPSNFEGNFTGKMLFRTALVKSRNLSTIRIAQEVGIPKVIEQAKKLGFTPDFPNELAISLGAVAVSPINLAQAYTAFANEGKVAKPRFITDITFTWGETIYQTQPELHQAISPENACMMSYLLKDVVQMGTGWRAKALKMPVAGKTGTSNEERDAWFTGFTPHNVTTVYVGRDQVAPMGKYETGGRAASPIFVSFHEGIAGTYPKDDFPVPDSITFARIDSSNGLLATPSSEESFTVPFIVGTEPKNTSREAFERGEDSVRSGEDLMKELF